MEKIISTNSMNESSLRNFSKTQLINLLLKQNAEIKALQQANQQQHQPTPIQKPIPTPHKSVKQMIQEYEDNIIPPPLEFRDDYKPIPKPMTKIE